MISTQSKKADATRGLPSPPVRDLDPDKVRYLEVRFPRKSGIRGEKRTTPTIERSAFYVPTDVLMRKVSFSESRLLRGVLVTQDIHALLKTALKDGRVGLRYGKDGLENDLSRQQIILYTMIIWKDYVLFYQRPQVTEVGKTERKYLGDKRLQGKVAVGFGGHKTLADFEHAVHNLMFVDELFPGLMPEMSNLVCLNIGFLNEIREELGIRTEDSRQLTLLGGFRDLRAKSKKDAVDVSYVHTAIVGVLELSHDVDGSVGVLRLPAHEVSAAWWVRLGNIKDELRKVRQSVEPWSEVLIREFLPHYARVKSVSQRKTHCHLPFGSQL